jgi:hypothetical protein
MKNFYELNQEPIQSPAILQPKEIIMAKRELIEPNRGDKRYVRREENGRFAEQVDVGRSLAADRRQHSNTPAKPGHGDKGDRQKTR